MGGRIKTSQASEVFTNQLSIRRVHSSKMREGGRERCLGKASGRGVLLNPVQGALERGGGGGVEPLAAGNQP